MKKKNKGEPPLRLAIVWILLILFLGVYENKRPILSPLPAEGVQWESDQESVEDSRIRTLDEYFEGRRSPLAGFGADFVRVADRWGFDYRTMVIISCIESSCGKNYPVFTHNPFGIYGGSGGVMRFRSISESIDYLGKLLGEASYYRAWRETKEVQDLARVYCPPNYQKWTQDYKFFEKEIENAKRNL